MNSREAIYYQMLENVHLAAEFNFWQGEIYTAEEFEETGVAGLLEDLLEKNKCKLFDGKRDSQMPGNNKLKKEIILKDHLNEDELLLLEQTKKLVKKDTDKERLKYYELVLDQLVKIAFRRFKEKEVQ